MNVSLNAECEGEYESENERVCEEKQKQIPFLLLLSFCCLMRFNGFYYKVDDGEVNGALFILQE